MFTIDLSNTRHIFIKTFQLESRCSKSVFAYLQWFCKTYECTFPSQAHIAQVCGYSISQIKRVLKKFRELEFIVSTKRPYQSCIYQVHEDLLNINLNDPATFRRLERVSELMGERENERVLMNRQETRGIEESDVQQKIKSLQKNFYQPQTIVSYDALTVNEQRYIFDTFTEWERNRALERAEKHQRENAPIGYLGKFLIGLLRKIRRDGRRR